jgi:hypothetical protein
MAFIGEGFGREDGRAGASRPTRSIDNHATMEEASSWPEQATVAVGKQLTASLDSPRASSAARRNILDKLDNAAPHLAIREVAVGAQQFQRAWNSHHLNG